MAHKTKKKAQSRNDLKESDSVEILEDTLDNDSRIGEDEKKEIANALKAFSDGDYIDPEYACESRDLKSCTGFMIWGEIQGRL